MAIQTGLDRTNEWDAWATLYDLEHKEQSVHDLPFYLAAAQAAPPVLELGCGTGRLTIPIAQAGVPITGLDISAKMLAHARAKAGDLNNVTFVPGDMSNFDLDQTFGLIFIAYSGFLVLKQVEAQEQTLCCIRRHLRPDGCLIMDMFVPNQEELGTATTDLNATTASLRLVRRLHHPHNHQMSLIWEAVSHIPNEQTFQADRLIQTFDSAGKLMQQTQHTHINGRYLYRYELYHLLRLSGFNNIQLYGDFRQQPFGPTSTRMVWEASLTA